MLSSVCPHLSLCFLSVFPLFLSLPSVFALPSYPARVPNGEAGARDGSGLACRFLGHKDCVPGAPRNQFGKDFAAAGRQWTVALCETDSDGDGFTNGQELGDPCCKWTTTNGAQLRLTDLSHPGDPASFNTAPRRCPTDGTTPSPTSSQSSSLSYPPSHSSTPPYSASPSSSPSSSPSPFTAFSVTPTPTSSNKEVPTSSASTSASTSTLLSASVSASPTASLLPAASSAPSASESPLTTAPSPSSSLSVKPSPTSTDQDVPTASPSASTATLPTKPGSDFPSTTFTSDTSRAPSASAAPPMTTSASKAASPSINSPQTQSASVTPTASASTSASASISKIVDAPDLTASVTPFGSPSQSQSSVSASASHSASASPSLSQTLSMPDPTNTQQSMTALPSFCQPPSPSASASSSALASASLPMTMRRTCAKGFNSRPQWQLKCGTLRKRVEGLGLPGYSVKTEIKGGRFRFVAKRTESQERGAGVQTLRTLIGYKMRLRYGNSSKLDMGRMKMDKLPTPTMKLIARWKRPIDELRVRKRQTQRKTCCGQIYTMGLQIMFCEESEMPERKQNSSTTTDTQSQSCSEQHSGMSQPLITTVEIKCQRVCTRVDANAGFIPVADDPNNKCPKWTCVSPNGIALPSITPHSV